MNKENNATETNVSTIASKEGTNVGVPTETDYEALYAASKEKEAKAVEEAANYKLAYLKGKNKQKSTLESEEDEDEESRLRRITREELANSALADIAREQQDIITKALKENKELKLAQRNKATGTPTSVGSHTESKVVSDTIVTTDQIEAFKKRGWTDKDIERYKKTYIKNSR